MDEIYYDRHRRIGDERNDVVTLTANVGARENASRGEVVKSHGASGLLAPKGRPGVFARLDRFSWLISWREARRSVSSPRHVRMPFALRVCVCARARARVSWVRSQRLSGVIESCLQGAALRCSSRALPLGEGNHNAI